MTYLSWCYNIAEDEKLCLTRFFFICWLDFPKNKRREGKKNQNNLTEKFLGHFIPNQKHYYSHATSEDSYDGTCHRRFSFTLFGISELLWSIFPLLSFFLMFGIGSWTFVNSTTALEATMMSGFGQKGMKGKALDYHGLHRPESPDVLQISSFRVQCHRNIC